MLLALLKQLANSDIRHKTYDLLKRLNYWNRNLYFSTDDNYAQHLAMYLAQRCVFMPAIIIPPLLFDLVWKRYLLC